MNRYGAVGLLMLVVGVALFGGGAYTALQQEQGLSGFANTQGTVLSTSLDPAEGDRFYPNVTYRYTVNETVNGTVVETTYTSNRIFPDETRRPSPRSDAEEVVGRYRVGQNVTVYYPEDNHSKSSLRAPRSPVPIFAVGIGFTLAAFGVLFTAAGRQGGMDPIETDEVTLVDQEPTPRGDADDGEVDDGDDGDDDDGADLDAGDDGPSGGPDHDEDGAGERTD